MIILNAGIWERRQGYEIAGMRLQVLLVKIAHNSLGDGDKKSEFAVTVHKIWLS